MSRLVVISNRLADPRKPAAGGLAVALGEALNQTGGLWFRWSGTVVEGGTPGEGELHTRQAGRRHPGHRGPVPRRPRQLLPRLQQQRAVAGVPLPAGPGRLQRQLHRRLPPREPDVCAQAAAAAARRRCDLGARLPPDPAGRRAARHGLQAAHRLLSAHPHAAAAHHGGHPRSTSG